MSCRRTRRPHLPSPPMRVPARSLAATLLLGAALPTAPVATARAQAAQAAQAYATSWDPKLLQRPDVRNALGILEKNFPQQVEEWVRLAEMPGKSRLEQQR